MAILNALGVQIPQMNFPFKQGADLTLDFTWLKDDGTPMDLTGYSMEASFRTFAGSPVSFLMIQSGPTIGSRIDIFGNTGSFAFVFAGVDTALFQPKGLPLQSYALLDKIRSYSLGVYDLKYTTPAGLVGYLFEGSNTLDPNITT